MKIVFVMIAALLIGCTQGQRDSMSTLFSRAKVEEVHTENLICGKIQFVDRISISCVAKRTDMPKHSHIERKERQ